MWQLLKREHYSTRWNGSRLRRKAQRTWRRQPMEILTSRMFIPSAPRWVTLDQFCGLPTMAPVSDNNMDAS